MEEIQNELIKEGLLNKCGFGENTCIFIPVNTKTSRDKIKANQTLCFVHCHDVMSMY